ncbi:hypothetical protein JA1_001043 [Spathaspora sp. JA1]|nr:hypothetical protein JA1_001043 [Spathaspora sp. JA1]
MKSLSIPGMELNRAMPIIPNMPIDQQSNPALKQNYDHSNIMSLQSSTNSILNASPSPKSKPLNKSGRTSPISLSNESSMADIFQVLGISNEQQSSWPYDTATLQGLIRFREQQEKTRQESLKRENMTLALDLLKLAQEMNISTDMIPKLFASEPFVLVNSLNQLQEFKSQHDDDIKSKKRTYSDTQISEIDKERKNIIQTISHGSSPLPNNEALTNQKDKPFLLPPINTKPRTKQHSPKPPASHKAQENQASPRYVQQPLIYPRYYTPQSEIQSNANPGSPGFHPYIYPTPIQYPAPQYYFVPPNAQPIPPPQPPPYLLNVPLPLQKTPPTVPLQSPESIKANKEEPTGRKKKNTGINFMISTPTNPPARKYNISKIK